MAVPVVTTQGASGIALTSATGNGTIVSGSGITRRGFQFNTVQAEDRQVYEDGSFSAGAYTNTIGGLTPGQTYWYRAFATNTDGAGYGGWTSFIATAPTYNVTIAGVNRTDEIMANTLVITDEIDNQVNTCKFIFDDLSDTGLPSNDDEITITLDDGTVLFGGYVININLQNSSWF